MPKFRKKPVTVWAKQVPRFDDPGDATRELELWLGEWFETWLPSGDQIVFRVAKAGPGVEATVLAGDWIIAEPDGTGFYPCTAVDFAATYEPATG